MILGLTGVGLAGAAALGALLIRQADPRSLDANLIVIAPFDVFDPELGLWREGLVDILSRNLDGAGSLRAVSPRVAIRRWSGRAEPAEAKGLGRRTGAQLVVFGQLVGSGPDSVRLTATLLDVGADRSLGEVDLRDALAHMDRLIDSTAVALLRVLGRHRPVGAVRQAAFGGTSLPALKEFLRGEQFYRRSAWDSALTHYEAAIALDSTFALAFRRMQLSLTWNPPTARSFQSPQAYAFRAAAFNRGLPARDSLLIVMDSLLWGMGWEDTAYFAHRRRAFAALDQVARLNPSDPEVWNVLGEVRFHWGTPAEFTEGRSSRPWTAPSSSIRSTVRRTNTQLPRHQFGEGRYSQAVCRGLHRFRTDRHPHSAVSPGRPTPGSHPGGFDPNGQADRYFRCRPLGSRPCST